MENFKYHTPIYEHFIALVEKGFAALDDDAQEEVKRFVTSCQHANGGFTDRAGNTDYYYSLFGTWLSVALGLKEVLIKHQQFIIQTDNTHKNQINELAALLIKISFSGNIHPKPTWMRLFHKMFLKRSSVSFFYRIFLFFLVFDALYASWIINTLARGVFIFVSPLAGSPCSFHAAYTVAKIKSGGKIESEQQKLLLFFEPGKGFKAFIDADGADLLSTAVALYALQAAGADLRNYAPACLNLIQQNYENGAFLAGNGDAYRDLEYTFYGLMALGILV